MNRFFNVSTEWLRDHWRGIASALIVATIAVLILSLQIDTLVQGQSKFETQTLASIKTFPNPFEIPVNAPYSIPTYLLGSTTGNMLNAARLISAVYGLLAAACLFYVVKKWFNIRIATVGTLLFITSSWLLHVSHMANPAILMVFSPLLCLAAFTWLLRAKKFKYLAIFAFAAAVAFADYIPYMQWILIVTFVVLLIQSRKKLKEIEPWQWLAGIALWITLILPLIIATVQHPGIIKILFGIPAVLPSVSEYAHNLMNLVLMPFFRAPLTPELHLGRLPLLDIFSTAMFILGAYHYAKKIKNRRSIILFCSMALLILVLPLSSLFQLNATILLSLVYVCIISGIVELLNEWFSFFPRNPLARTIGVFLVVAAIGFTSFYHLQRYFIAWPNTPDTKAVYVVKSE